MPLRTWLLVAVISGLIQLGSARAQEGESRITLAERLTPLAQAHQGDVAIAVKHLATGESFVLNGDDPMPTASLIKLAVMVEAYRQSSEGALDLNALITLREADKVPGSGVLTSCFSDGSTLRLRDAVRLMIAVSDNTATNLVLDRIGIDATGKTMKRWGYSHTNIHSKVFRRDTSIDMEGSQRFGLGSTTANETLRLLEAIHARQVVSPEACEAMLDHLRACDDREKFPRYLPDTAKLAYKTGSIEAARTAAGLMETPTGTVALCVLTSRNADRSWSVDNAGNRLCAEVARSVFIHFGGKIESGANLGFP